MNADALAQIHAECFSTPRPWSADELRGMMDDRFTACITSENGFAVIRVVLDEAELLTICVAPSARGTGEGRGLLELALHTAKERGAENMFLEVAANNATAIGLYRSVGFVDSGFRKDYYRTPDGARIDALLLQLPLSQR